MLLGSFSDVDVNTEETSIENKQLRNFDYFRIILPCLNHTMAYLAKYASTGLQGALLKYVNAGY